MDDKQLEQTLARRQLLMPDATDVVTQALDTLELNQAPGVVATKHNIWAVAAVLLPTVGSGLLVYSLRKDQIIDFTLQMATNVPANMHALADVLQQSSHGLSSGLVISLMATAVVGCLAASWTVGMSFVRESRV